MMKDHVNNIATYILIAIYYTLLQQGHSSVDYAKDWENVILIRKKDSARPPYKNFLTPVTNLNYDIGISQFGDDFVDWNGRLYVCWEANLVNHDERSREQYRYIHLNCNILHITTAGTLERRLCKR